MPPRTRRSGHSTAPKQRPQPLTRARYAELLRDVHQLVVGANSAIDQRKVVAYWNLGRRIARERTESQSGYHNSILRDLATDAQIAMRTLQYAVTFHSGEPGPWLAVSAVISDGSLRAFA